MEIVREKETDFEEMTPEETNDESVPKESDKTLPENIEEENIEKENMEASIEASIEASMEEENNEEVSTQPIQNEHPMSSQMDSHLFNYFSKVDDKNAGNQMDIWECERSLPWSRAGEREQNLSVQMFLYMLNNDIKSKIANLDQKEFEACRAHKWDEALRLRGMKSKLNLTREHQLINAVGLKLDEETRFAGMEGIAKRQNVVEKREKLITDGNLYSEEAKELWKKWEAEDNQLEMNTPFTERAGLMQSLEEEWKTLADEDKDRIALLYGRSKPDLSIEHCLKKTQNYTF